MHVCKKNIDKQQNINYEHEYEIRKKKLNKIKKQGFNFPNNFKPNINIASINKKYSNKTNIQLTKINITVQIAGRIMKQRIMGKASFITIQDMQGEIQIYISEKKISFNFYHQQFKKWDIGDIISVYGKIFKTKTGQLSIYCYKTNLLSKSIQPFPDKFHGLINKEIRYRKRYLDLLFNKKTMNNFIQRSNILMIIRKFMNKNHFLEVETPMLQSIPGGAKAEPFITHHKSLNIKMYLRIAPELYLKKLIIGGFEKIYEINRNFRNEGISLKHNPEFTMMELYMVYSDYHDLMEFIIHLLKYIVYQIHGVYTIEYQNHPLQFCKPFQKFTIIEAILYYNQYIKKEDLQDIKKIKKIANLNNIKIKSSWSIEKIITKIFTATTENKLIQPTFITEYPIEVSPLSKRNSTQNNLADRFEFFMGGMEIANGFSELNDYQDQKERFLQQAIQEKNKNNQKHFYDQEYITALEYGMPPTAGLGIGIDRLVMILTNQTNIRDIILFPTLKPNTK